MKSRSAEIEQQLAHLRWRRLQNERAIRNALQNTKALQQNDTMMQISMNNCEEKKKWMTQIIEDELSKLMLSVTEIGTGKITIQGDESRVKGQVK